LIRSPGAIGTLANLLGETLLKAWVIVSHHMPSAVGIIVCLGVGALGGLINGVCCAFTSISPFIVTLAVSSVAVGLTLVISQGNTISPLPNAYDWLGAATWGEVPYLFFLIIALFIVAEFMLRRSVLGRELYALGGNPRAAAMAGISKRKLQIGVYTTAGLLYGIAGLAQVGILGAATTGAGSDDLLTPIAAAVIGGVSLFGGEGSVVGAGLGIIVIGIISDGTQVDRRAAIQTRQLSCDMREATRLRRNGELRNQAIERSQNRRDTRDGVGGRIHSDDGVPATV